MAESVYKIIELVGTSTESWEKAAAAAVEKASKSLRDLRIAEVSELDLQIEKGKGQAYRAKVKVSFKYEEQVRAPGEVASARAGEFSPARARRSWRSGRRSSWRRWRA